MHSGFLWYARGVGVSPLDSLYPEEFNPTPQTRQYGGLFRTIGFIGPVLVTAHSVALPSSPFASSPGMLLGVSSVGPGLSCEIARNWLETLQIHEPLINSKGFLQNQLACWSGKAIMWTSISGNLQARPASIDKHVKLLNGAVLGSIQSGFLVGISILTVDRNHESCGCCWPKVFTRTASRLETQKSEPEDSTGQAQT